MACYWENRSKTVRLEAVQDPFEHRLARGGQFEIYDGLDWRAARAPA